MGDLGRWGVHLTPTTWWQRVRLFFRPACLIPLDGPADGEWVVVKSLGRRVFIVGVKGAPRG